MAPWNPLQFLQQKAAEAQRAIQSAPRMAGQVWQQRVVPAARQVQRVAAPAIRDYRQTVPASIRAAVNPFSTAGPSKPGFGRGLRFLSGQFAADWVINKAAEELLPPRLANEVSELYGYTTLPVPHFLKPALPIVLGSRPVNADEDEMMAQVYRDYEQKKRAAETAQKNKTETGLEAGGPGEPAYGPPTTKAPVASTSPRDAAAQVTAPSQPPEMSPLAKEYAQQQRIAELLGAEEMVRRMNAARPMTTVSDEDLLTWADANKALAYREMLRRESLAN
jgi:hypothetical protein